MILHGSLVVMVMAMVMPVWSRVGGHKPSVTPSSQLTATPTPPPVSTIQLQTVTTSTPPGLATWLWDSELILNDALVAEFLTNTKALGITSVYAQINRDIGNPTWELFVGKCIQNGMRVEALFGNAQWIVGSGVPTLDSQLEWITTYQGSAGAGSKFGGIHVDVEPWSLPTWSTNQASHLVSFQTIMLQISTLGKSLSLPVTADLPFWASEIILPTSQTLDLWTLSVLDTAVFMTYRNTASQVLDIAKPALEAGKKSGKKVWLAVETREVAEGALISYFGKDREVLVEDLENVKSAASGSYEGSFAGIAVHDYTGLIALG